MRYVRGHPLEAAMVVLPFLRPLRLLRVLRIARVAVALGVNTVLIRDLVRRRGTGLAVTLVLSLCLAGAAAAFGFEREAPGSNIRTFEDALWWAASTMTTVGYGDYFPVTPAGRGIAIALMLFGIAALSVLTATIAALIVKENDADPELRRQVEELIAEVRALRQLLEADQ